MRDVILHTLNINRLDSKHASGCPGTSLRHALLLDMSGPGFSVSELVQALDNSTKLVIKLSEAPSELQNVIRVTYFAVGILKSWKRHIEQHQNDIHKDDYDQLVRTTSAYDSVIQNLNNFANRHGKLQTGNLGSRFKWVFSEHFWRERASLEESLTVVERQMHTVMQTLNWYVRSLA